MTLWLLSCGGKMAKKSSRRRESQVFGMVFAFCHGDMDYVTIISS
jgi:hypothetical protein